MRRLFTTLLVSLLLAVPAMAQKMIGAGQVSGSLESTSIGYVNDKKLGATPEDHFGSNNYLKVDYANGRFSAGIQIDGYLPALYGYDVYRFSREEIEDPKGKRLFGGFLTKYIQWEDTNYGIRVGDIYDQFGNGLIFRAYEERALGFNNSVAGARVHYNLKNYFNIKVLAGSPRLYDERSYQHAT